MLPIAYIASDFLLGYYFVSAHSMAHIFKLYFVSLILNRSR
uniref:Uncharacterized protein n=1 Tax=Anguilla anguilla TaxID=7936 RepID=A0A0E9SEK2_ANGAN